MKTTGVLILQSWFDIAILYTGNAWNAFEIANANNRSVTDDLVNGEFLNIPEGLILDHKTMQYYEARKIVPATGLTKETLDLLSTEIGIGKMALETNFIVA